VSVPTIDTFGCARFHPFGNGKPQKRAGAATRERRKPWRRQAPPFPEPVIHRELAFPPKFPGRADKGFQPINRHKKSLLICSRLQQFSKIISPPNRPLAAPQ
jgi:hypothetical protein